MGAVKRRILKVSLSPQDACALVIETVIEIPPRSAFEDKLKVTHELT